MANPIQNQQHEAQVAAPQEHRLHAPAPEGIGAAQTTMQSAKESQEYKLGYVETAVHWVRDWVVWIFQKVFYCWFPEPVLPSLPEPPPPIEPPELREEIQVEVRVLNALDRLTERERERIYHLIGIEAYRIYYPGQWLRSHEEIGRIEVLRNPLILEKYITFQQTQMEI